MCCVCLLHKLPLRGRRRNRWWCHPRWKAVLCQRCSFSFSWAFPVLFSLSLHVQLTAVAFIVHFFTHIAAVTIDPADASVRAKHNYSTAAPLFDRSKQVHAIQDLHCYLCEIKVYVTTAPALKSFIDHAQQALINNNNAIFVFLIQWP